ncbi:MAG: hypothetical protein HC887_11130 [Desulfobacteraceae bacterium]|nr:hypothetical protein [Desulfobacteraceae bacterium]
MAALMLRIRKHIRWKAVTVTATKTEVSQETVPFTAHSVERETIEKQPDYS